MKHVLLYFSLLIISFSCTNKKRIGLQPYKGFNSKLTDTIAQAINQVYTMNVVVMSERPHPADAIVKHRPNRYRADKLLIDLKNNMDDSFDFILGLTHSDISTTKKNADGTIKEPRSKYADWGIFGLGYRPGPSCVVSTYRLKNINQNLFVSSLKKVCIHEIGHNLGLDHCINKDCVMQDAVETINTVDAVEMSLCNECKREIN